MIDLAVSADGNQVYAAVTSPTNGVMVFDRNAGTGALTVKAGADGCVSDTGNAPCATGTALDGPHTIVVSPDGANVYLGMGLAGGSDSVAIFAQGPVGLCATIAAKFYGADPIVAVDGIAHRRGVAERLGATHTFSPEDAVGRTSDLTGGMGVDVAVEALGRQETLDACFRVTRAGGTVSSVGVYAPLDVVRVPVDDRFYQRSFVTTLCPSGPKRLDWLLGLVRDGRIDVAPLFTHTAALSTIVDAYDRFRRHDDNILKIALAP